MMRFAVLLALELALIFLIRGEAAIQESPPLSMRLDAGSDHPSQDHSDRLYLADQEWSPETQAGHVGGYPVWSSSKAHPVDGTLDEFLHTNQRHGWEAYRFSNIRNGDYLVTLSFSEVGVPLYTVFDVAIEGQTVLDDFRIFDHVGGNYALTRRFAATVTDRELNVTAKPVVGDPRLAALEVAYRPPDDDAPAVPLGLVSVGNYSAVLLDWADNIEDDLDGYHIYRAATSGGPFTRLTAGPIHISRYQDTVVTPHVTLYYRITAVDVYGNESEPTSAQSGSALAEDDATLPLFELEVAPESLIELYTHALSDEEVGGVFTYKDQAFPVTVRYRGGYGRYVHKKPWKINFPNGSPFPGRDQINLRADYIDPTLMSTKLATELFEAAGVLVPEAEYVVLTLNGEYQGVYILNEQVDEGFLERTGLDPQTSIYKAVHTDAHDFTRAQPSEEAYYQAYEKKTNREMGYDDVIDFIKLINNAPDETFAYELARIFDVAAYLDFYAVTVLISNGDFVHHNAYLLHDLSTDRWGFVPYDFDVIFRQVDRPIDEGTSASPIQPRGWNSALLTRLLDVPQFRTYYCHRLAEFMGSIFSDATMLPLIDATYDAIEQDGLRDWHKRGRENSAWFVGGPDGIKTYVTERREFLQDEMARYCSPAQPYLSINEVMVDNRTVLEDPDEPREFPAWFEIHNRGLEPVDLSGMCLTNDLADPNRFSIPAGSIIPPGGFVAFFADGEAEQGPRHTSFKLDGSGGQLGIFSGTQQIDAHTFGPQAADAAEGRYPDGVDNWRLFNVPTPGRSNLLLAPVISSTVRAPFLPTVFDGVTVTAAITDDGALVSLTLYYRDTGGGFVEVPMTSLGGDRYAARIPPQPSGSLVEYYVLARDSDGRASTDPSDTAHNLYQYTVDYRPPTLYINEFLANTLRGSGETAKASDWIELYNPSPDPVDLSGRYLSDDLDNPTKFRIADGTVVPAGGFLTFYADNGPDQGPLHTNFRLSRRGGSVGLSDAGTVDHQPIDIYAFGPQAAGVSEGRCPDGSDTWVLFDEPTPGTSNSPCGTLPIISKAGHSPPSPSATDEVTVTAVIAGDGAAITATLWTSAEIGFEAIPMVPIGAGVYAATIPAQPAGTTVAYYIRAESDRGPSVADPSSAPADAYRYTVGYQPPPLFVNEFMAENGTTWEDPDEAGEFPDWIELYNAGSAPIDLGEKYLTDDLTNPTKFRIPEGLTIPSGGFILFYADDDPEQGPFHANFKLSKYGGDVGLFDSDATGNQPLDTYAYGLQAADLSERRRPDGGDTWAVTRTPTPGMTNAAVGRQPYLPAVLRQAQH
jgi:spore coat protein CotH